MMTNTDPKLGVAETKVRRRVTFGGITVHPIESEERNTPPMDSVSTNTLFFSKNQQPLSSYQTLSLEQAEENKKLVSAFRLFIVVQLAIIAVALGSLLVALGNSKGQPSKPAP